jgi:hypothetical protein
MVSVGWRRRKRIGRNTTVNYSTGGVSVSHRCGPFTMNSRGHVRLRLPGGFYIRIF